MIQSNQQQVNIDRTIDLGSKKLKIICSLLGITPFYFYIFVKDADAFSFSIFTINQLPIPEDIIILLLGAGIVGFIGLGRRKLKK